MATTVPKEALRTLIAELSGIPVSRVYWDGDPERATIPIGGKAGKITLNVVARASLGHPEVRRAFDIETEEQTDTWGDQRVLTVSVRADNFLGLGEAFDLLEKVRMRIRWRSAKDTLNEAGLAFVDAPSIVSLDYNVDNRAVSSASLDVRLAQVITDAPDTDDETNNAGWIEEVIGEGEYTK